MTSPPTPRPTTAVTGEGGTRVPVGLPDTGDGPVDAAMALLGEVRGDGGAQDGQVLTAVHEALQHRLRSTG